MSWNRTPLFCFAMLATSLSLIFALPALTADLVFLELQRKLGFHFFDPETGMGIYDESPAKGATP